MRSRWHILVVDDEEAMTESLAAWLREDGYTVDTASSGREAIEKARAREYAIYFVDLKMPGGLDGIETMMEIRKLQEEASVIIITAYATVDTAIAAMKEGAQEYVVKPCNPQEISLLVERIIRVKNLQRENAILRRKLSRQYRFHDLVSKSPRMAEIFELVREVASQRSTVLIQGESGTGKELVARAIHFSGDRGERPFVAVSCAALAETLLESELFGHEKGAFTGAVAQKKGKFELADGGTLFLDEIGDISPKLQVDLLRVLQERRFFRVGGTTEIARGRAGHRRHPPGPRGGRAGGPVPRRSLLPPQRDRHPHSPAAGADRGRAAPRAGVRRPARPRARPRGVRHLGGGAAPPHGPRLAGERARAGERGREGHGDLQERRPRGLRLRLPVPGRGGAGRGSSLPPGLTLQEMEKDYIAATLGRLQGNVKAAAEALGIDRSTLYEKIKRYEIPR